MDGNLIFAATAAAICALGVFDRFALKRGKVDVLSLRPAGEQGAYLRFVLCYQASSRPEWSELTYSFRDHCCPTTVIAGKTRSLFGCEPGMNQEYLLIRKDLLHTGRWDMCVKLTTTSRRNPFYSLFPFVSQTQIEVTVDG